ncbi:MAG TPA: DUF4129 domain-containing protein [Thermoplasmata archaeon]|nr:DUF4129 domain-containing protein [Thermoplasmata archaeon]
MPEGQGPSPFVIVAIVVAVLVGVVAAVLVGTAPTPPAPRAGELSVTLPDQVWGLLFLSPLLVGLSMLVARRLLGENAKHPRRVLITVGVAALLAILFVAFSTYGSTGNSGTVSVGSGLHPPVNNSTPTNGTPGSNGSQGSGATGLGPASSVGLPAWSLLLTAAGLSAAVGLLAVPGALALLVGRRRRGRRRGSDGDEATAADRQEARDAIAEAARAIDRGDDPRATIVRLYMRLLVRFGPKLGEVGPLTPEEIRALVLDPLHVRRDASEALTRLFEEARYSAHPMGSEAAERCRVAFGTVESDLGRVPLAG